VRKVRFFHDSQQLSHILQKSRRRIKGAVSESILGLNFLTQLRDSSAILRNPLQRKKAFKPPPSLNSARSL